MKAGGKIIPLDALAALLNQERDAGRRVVLCHGVFDLLHVGHIRHFESAREHGDLLVVTITPDRFVNKGPHRPAFTDELRAETLAALDCVDYVAVNRWPSAEETILLLKPTFYVKGADYEDEDQDVTGGIKRERDAVASVGGQIIFTHEITYSSTELINRHFSGHSAEVRVYLDSLATRHSAARIRESLDGLRDLKVLIVGEAIIDEYQYCTALGKSAKDPMLAVKRLRATKFAGGVLAVANHLAAFCETPTVLTQLGSLNSMEDFIRANLHPDVKPIFLHRRSAPTIVKQRIIDEYSFTKLLSVYDWNDEPLDPVDNAELCGTLEKITADFDLVLVIDYGHSMMTPEAVELLLGKARFLAVNAQSNAGNLGFQSISKYPRADLVCIASAELLHEMRNRTGDCEKLIHDLKNKLDYDRVIVTLGKTGCEALDRHDETLWKAPSLASRVADRMGGGDAFLSIAAPCLAGGLPMELACFLGSVAAGHAVGTVGHERSIERAGFHKAIEALLK